MQSLEDALDLEGVVRAPLWVGEDEAVAGRVPELAGVPVGGCDQEVVRGVQVDGLPVGKY